MDLFEYQGKQFFARYDIPVSPGEARDRRSTTAVAAAEPHRLPGRASRRRCRSAGGARPAASSSPANADEAPHARRRTSSGWTSRATSSTSSGSSRRRDIAEEYYAQLHARPRGQEAPRHAVGAGRRRDRGGGREGPRRHRQDLDRPGRRADRAQAPRAGSSAAKLNPKARRRRGRHPAASCTAAYVDGDADLVEINPLILTPDGRVHALDAKVTLDDNAVFRHPDYEQYDATQVRDEREQAAHEQGPAVRRPRRLRRHHRQRRRPGHEHASTSSTRSAASRPTSSTSAAAPTPT